MLLAVRGDLQSETGWARAIRALVEAIADDFSVVVGVDLHYHPARSRSAFPGAIVDDATLLRLLQGSKSAVVLHATQPDGIFAMANAINVGWWFWETDRLPTSSDWLERIGSLDVIMVPSEWQAQVIERLRLPVDVIVAPWPHRLADATIGPKAAIKGTPLASFGAYKPCDRELYLEMLDIDRRYHRTVEGVRDPGRLSTMKQALFRGRRTSLGEALDGTDGYMFAVQSDAPRKGLAPLISEWCAYRARAATRHALVVRFSSLNVQFDAATNYQRFWETALAASRGAPGLEDVILILETLSEAEMAQVYAGATAFVSATFGEGFGGTLVEAVQAGCPVIAPRHTACAQLIPEHYPGAFETVPYVGALVGQLAIQPANGSWHLPVPGRIAERMLRAETLSPEARAGDARALLDHMRRGLAPEHARQSMRRAIESARAAWASARAARVAGGNADA